MEEFEFLPLAFHGYIMFRASSSSQVNFNGWYTDENNPIPLGSNQFDLFSVTLHEVMHMLGFSTNLGTNGAPVQTLSTNYDRFDSFLQLDTGTPVITNTPAGSYNWQLNINPADLHQSCQGSSSGPDMVFQPLSGSAVPIFTGGSYISGSSFAHLGLDCDGTTTAPFVMRPSIGVGEATSTLTPEELQILCALGYSVIGTCDCELAGVDDYGPACTPDLFELEICPGEAPTLGISIQDLIGNDPGATGIIQFEPFSDIDGTLVADTDPNTPADFIFTPERFGVHRLRYIPTNSTCGFPANETYVYINAVAGESCACDFFDGTSPNDGANNYGDCNLVCNPEISYQLADDAPNFLSFSLPTALEQGYVEIPGWIVASESPDLQIGSNNPSNITIGNSGSFNIATSFDLVTGEASITESMSAEVAVLPGRYFWSTYWYTGFSSLTHPPGLRVYLVNQQVRDDYFHNPLLGIVYAGLEIENFISGMNNNKLIGDYPDFIGGTVVGSWAEKRVGSTLNVSAGEQFDYLWLTPQPGTAPLTSAELVFGVRPASIDQVELIRDNFAVQPDQTTTCGEAVTLLADDFCMLTDVVVQYEWREDDGQGNLSTILSYTVEKELDGLTIITDGNGNILPAIPAVDVLPGQDTRYVLERSVLDDGGIDGFSFDHTQEEVFIFIQALTLPADFVVQSCDLEISVTAASSGNVHSWDFGDGNTATGEYAVHTYEEPGTYTITHTIGAAGCEISDTQTITVPTATDIPNNALFTVTIAPECEDLMTAVNFAAADNNWNHTYTFSDGMVFSEPIVDINLSGGNYTVIHTVSNACGSVSETITFTVDDCLNCDDCDPATLIGIPGGSISLAQVIASGLLPPNGASNNTYCIVGKLNIESGNSYNFVDCDIRMLPGATIIVESDAFLGVGNTNFYSCEGLWEGIRVARSGELKMSNSAIHNAYSAVSVTPNDNGNQPLTNVQLIDNDFYNNFMGLYIEPTPTAGGGSMYLQLALNNFMATESLLPTGAVSLVNGLPVPDGRSLLGVFFNDLSLVSSSYNNFTNLASGLIARNTDANILGNNFSNMQLPVNTYTNYDYREIGVATERDSDELYLVVLTESTFEQCNIGLSSDFTNLNVYGNEMRTVRTGITASLPNMGPIAIGGEGNNRNNILASHNGILAAGFATNSALQIENNLINLSAANGRRGIRLAGSLSETADIVDNRIRLAGTGRGMELLAIENTRVNTNDIRLLNSPQANYGISLRNAEQVLLEGNTVRGSAVTGDADKNIGIEIFSSPDIGYCCNTLDDTRLGVRVLGSSLSTDQFRGTSFGDHATGLQLEAGALLGSQSHTENTWLGSYSSGFGAVYDVDPLIAQVFPFFVDVTGSNGDPTFSTTSSPTGWFQIGENPSPQNFCSEDQCNLGGLIAPGDGQFLLAGGSNLNAFTEAVAWQSLMQAYEHYGLNSEIYSSTAANYVETMNSSEVGLYSQYTVAAKEVFTLPANERAAMDELLLTKANELALLNEWEAQFVSSGAIGLSQQNQDLRTKLFTDAWDTSQSTASRATVVLNNTLSTAATLLADDLPSETSYTANSEQSWKIQLALGIRPWNSGTVADLEILKTIASGCPLTDGNGVFRARALLAFLHGSEEVYSDEHCREKEDPRRNGRTEQSVPSAHANSSVVTTDLKVFPNPSQQRQVQVICPKNTTNAKLHLKTPQGQALHQWNLSEGQTAVSLQLDDLPPGLYYLQWSSGEEISTSKLILQ